jgi:beta-glucosidase
MGWGSGTANFPYLDDPLTAISAAAPNVVSYNTDTFPLVVNATAGDIAIVFVNSDSGEGYVFFSTNFCFV